MRRSFLFALALALALLGRWGIPAARHETRLLAQVQCGNMCSGMTDVSYANVSGSCGYNNWELEAQMDVSQTIYDEGEYDAWGVCYNYYDCDGNYYSDFINGDETLYDDGQDGGNESESFHWMLDDWYVSYTNVECSNGFQGASLPQFTDDAYSTIEFDECC
jgi:hypothetical protein